MRSSKDLAKRLRFDWFPRGDFFRRRYTLVGVAVTLLGVAAWAVLVLALRERQYVPGPVSLNHATFGDRCGVCHTSFAAVKNQSCEECHGKRTHSTNETRTPACRDCHVEHREGASLIAVAARPCVDCHAQLETKSPPVVERTVASFAAHPEFAPLRPPARDEAAIRFNHQLHLTSPNVVDRRDVASDGTSQPSPGGAPGKLTCPSCHVLDGRRRLMRPIAFATHCQRCHKQEVSGADPAGSGDAAGGLPVSIEALHDKPEVIRPDLMAKLVAAAVEHPEIFEGEPSRLPGIRGRPPVDASRTLRDYQSAWLERLERELYQPFDETKPLLEHNKRCFLCHLQTGVRAPGELPVVTPSKIPSRWLARAEFAHGPHEMLACRTCHAGVERSSATLDTNLPGRELCQRCHVDGVTQTAGTSCSLCHAYHDTTKDPGLHARRVKEVSLDTLRAP